MWKKTKAMLFFKTNDRNSKLKCGADIPELRIYGSVVEFVVKFKYLGIILDNCLLFKSHYQNVENKMNAALKRMYSLKRMMSDNVLKVFLSSFVSSIVDYGICFWCIHPDKEIVKLQNKINRFIVTFFVRRNKKMQKNELITQYFTKLDLLTIAERRKYM